MKKILTSFLMAAVAGCATAKAATVIADAGDGKYTISTGKTTMTVATDGGKILSYKYGDKEVISQTRFPNSFGSTFWTSPQKEWNWPPVAEFDRLPYTVEKGATLVMTSQKSERLGFVVRKEFAADEANEAIIVTYTIINKSDQTRQVAPWEITRVPNDGVIFFDAPVDKIWPADLMTFKSAHGCAWYQADEASQNRKVNADGKGWLAYCANGLLLVKQFADLDASQPAPGEAEIQVYVNQGKSFIEIESQGAYTTLQPGQSFDWTVRWSLRPYDGTPEPSSALAKMIAVPGSAKKAAASGSAKKSLVLYYSETGTTKAVAQELQKQLGADIESIEPVEPYSGDFQKTMQRGQREMQSGQTPELKPLKSKIADYDVIFLGYPIWFGTYATPIATLVKNYDFAGKTVVPFCTFGSGGLNTSSDALVKALPKAKIQKGYGVRTARKAAAEKELDRFLKTNGYKKGTVSKLPAYSAQKPVTEADKAIFDAACSSYQFPLGTPQTVGKRTTDDSTDYQFTVKSRGMDGTESTSTIYVTVGKEQGAKPEFTEVVR